MMKQARLIIITYKRSLSFLHRDYATLEHIFLEREMLALKKIYMYLVREGAGVARPGERGG